MQLRPCSLKVVHLRTSPGAFVTDYKDGYNRERYRGIVTEGMFACRSKEHPFLNLNHYVHPATSFSHFRVTLLCLSLVRVRRTVRVLLHNCQWVWVQCVGRIILLLNGQICFKLFCHIDVCAGIPFVFLPPDLLFVLFSTVPLLSFPLLASLIPSSSSPLSLATLLVTVSSTFISSSCSCLPCSAYSTAHYMFCMRSARCTTTTICAVNSVLGRWLQLPRRPVPGIKCRWRIAKISRDTMLF